VALSSDGRLLAAACSRLDGAGRPQGEVGLWEVDTGRRLRTLAAFDQAVYTLAFSADGRLLAAGSEGTHEIDEKGAAFGGGRVKVWDTHSGKERAAFATSDRVYALAFSPDGVRVAAGSVRFQTSREWPFTRPAQGEVRVWDIEAGREHMTFARHRAGVRALAFSPDGHVLATGGFDHAIKLWDVPARRELRTLSDHTGPLQALAYSADGLSLVSVSLDRTLKVWNTLTTQARLTLRASPAAQPRGAAFRSDGLGLLIVGTGTGSGAGDPFVELRRLGTSPEPALLPDSSAPLLLSPDGTTLAAANAAPGRNPIDRQNLPGVIRLWDTATAQGREPLAGHAFPIAALFASRDGKLLVSVANPDDAPSPGAPAPDGGKARPGEVKLWDATSGQETVSLPRLPGLVRGVALQPGGTLLAVVCGGRQWKGTPPSLHWQASTVQLYDTQLGHQVRTLAGHEGDVRALAFSADGKRLAVFSSGAPSPSPGESGASHDQIFRPCRLQTWDVGLAVRGGREASSVVLPLPRPDLALFSDGGRRLITGAGGQVTVWDVATGKQEQALAGHPAPMTGLTLTPDGKTAVTIGGGSVTVWDVQTLRERHAVSGAGSYALVEGGGRLLRTQLHLLDLDSGRALALANSVSLISANGRALLHQKDVSTLEVIHRPEPGTNEPPRSVPLSGPAGHPRFLTPDGRTLIAGALDGMSFKAWDTATGRERAAFPSPINPDPRLSPDGKVFLIRESQPGSGFGGGNAGRLTLWDVASGKRITTWENPEARRRRLAAVAALVGWGSAASPLARVDPALRVSNSVQQMGPLSQVAFSPDGKALVVASRGVTYVLEAATGRQIAAWDDRAPAYPSNGLRFLPDGAAVLIEEYGNNLETGQPGLMWKLRELPSGRARGELPLDLPTFTADSRTILMWGSRADAASGSEVLVWDAATGRLRRRLHNVPASQPTGFLPSPDGRAAAAWSTRQDGLGRVTGEVAWWDLYSGRELGRLREVPDFQAPIQWAPDGKSLFLLTRSGGFRQLRTADGAEPNRFEGAAPPLAITPDSRFLLASVPEGVRVWNLATGTVHGTLRHQAPVFNLAFHPDGPTLVTQADGGPKLWDLASGKEAPADSRRARALLDGRLRLAQDLSDPWSFYQPIWLAQLLRKDASPGPTAVLLNDRFRLVVETQLLKLWPSQSAGPAAGAESSEAANGKALVQKGRAEEAVADFRKAAREAPRDAEVRLLLADALDRGGERDRAVEALTEACRQDPRHAWLFAAFARSGAVRPKAALKLLDQALRYRPQDAALHFQRGEALAASGDRDGATACYEKCVDLDPEHGRAWRRLAELRLEQGQAASARKARLRLAEISPALADPEREQTVQAHLERLHKEFGTDNAQVGNRLSWDSYFDEAIPYLQRAVWWQSNQLFPLDVLGICLSSRGRYAEALGPFRRGLSLAPEVNRPWWSGEIRYAERGEEFEALRKQARTAEDLFRRRPDDAQAGRDVADAHARVLQYPKNARDYFAPGAELPGDPEMWLSLAAMLLLGQDADLNRRVCEHALGQAAKLTGPQEGRRIRNAYVIARMGALAEKPRGGTARLLPLAEQAVKESPDAWILHTLGLVYYRAGSYEDAVRALERSVKEHPGWAAQVVNFQALALAYHRLGKTGEARRWRRRAAERIERMEESLAVRTTGRWPLHPHDLLAMWLLEREIAREMPAGR
jgi:WD40 repeat protein/tetratricopeptide (TPR) repeat protein